MDTGQDREIWGDPYIGLRWAAEIPLEFAHIATHTPLFLLDAGHRTLGSPDVFTDIRDFLRNIWDSIFGPEGWIQRTVYPWFQNAFATISAYIYDVRDVIADIWNNAWNYVFGPESWLQRTAYPWLQGRFAILSTVLYDIRNSITEVWNNAWNYVFGPDSWLQRTAYPWIRTALATISTYIYDIRDVIAEIWNNAWNYVFGPDSWLRATAYPWIRTALATLSTFIFDIRDVIADVWNNLWNYVFDIDTDKLNSTIDAFEGWIRDRMGDFISIPERFLSEVAELAGTDLALEPSRALTTAGALYAMSIAAGSAAHVTATALNAIPTLNWVGASQLSAFIAQVAGFDEITKATYGTLLDGALSWPMRYHWNQLLRPRIPTEGAVFLMGRKRGLNRDEFGEAMGYHGLPEWWIDKEYQFFWTDPSPYWLLRMSEHATPAIQPSAVFRPWLDEWLPNWRSDPWAWFKMKLMLAGFEDTAIPAFIDGFQRRRLGPAVTQVKTSVRAMVREGYWGRIEAEAALRPMGVREEEIEYLILAEEIDYQNRFNDGQVLYYNESFRKGEISRQDLSLLLSTIIVKPERVAQIVSREVVRALPKPKAVVPVREDPRVKSLVTQAVNSWTKGYRAWELEEEELEIGLTIVLQDPDLAKQMVMVERTRYRPEPPPPKPPVEDPLIRKSRVAAIASWVSQFREAKITADVTSIFITNASGETATIDLEVVQDATP